MLCHNWPSCDPHFLYLLASSKQHSIFSFPSNFYYRHYAKMWKAKDFLFEVKRVSYSLVNYFLKLGIWLGGTKFWNFKFQIFKFWKGDTIFDSKLVGEKSWRKLWRGGATGSIVALSSCSLLCFRLTYFRRR